MKLSKVEVPERDRLLFKARQAPATATLIAIFIVVFAASVFDTDQRIFAAFAKVDEKVRQGELWRLFTASFLHGGLLHLWLNCVALWAIGPAVERLYGHLRYVAVFLLTGAAGMTASVFFVRQPSVGASAGIFGLLGVLLLYAVRSRARLPSQARRILTSRLLLVVGINIALGFLVPFIDSAGHIGGLLGGLVLGLVLHPTEGTIPRPEQLAQADQALRAAIVGAAAKKGRTLLGWAGQRWKVYVMLVGSAGAVVPWFVDLSDLWVLPASVGLGALALVTLASARCPACKRFVIAWAMSELPSNKAMSTVLYATACPICGYPDRGKEPRMPPASSGSEPAEFAPGGFFDRHR